jgi:hypothetical protein
VADDAVQLLYPPTYPRNGTYADLLLWHLKVWGTRPSGSTTRRGEKPWEDAEFKKEIFKDANKNEKDSEQTSKDYERTEKQFRAWTGESATTYAPGPDNGKLIAAALFDNQPQFESWAFHLETVRKKTKGNIRSIEIDVALAELLALGYRWSPAASDANGESLRTADMEKISPGSPLGTAFQSYFDSPPYKSKRLGSSDVWTVKLFASAVGVSDSAVRQWLRGDTLPTQNMPSIIWELFGPERDRFQNEINELWRILRQHESVRLGTRDSTTQNNPTSGWGKDEMHNPETNGQGFEGEHFSDTPQTAENIANEADKKDRESNIEAMNQLRSENQNLRQKIELLKQKLNGAINEENIIRSKFRISYTAVWIDSERNISNHCDIILKELFLDTCPILFCGESIDKIQESIENFTELAINKNFSSKKMDEVTIDESIVQKFLLKMVDIGYIHMSISESRYHKYNTEYKITEKGTAFWTKSSR